jgi:hypothetical protein
LDRLFGFVFCRLELGYGVLVTPKVFAMILVSRSKGNASRMLMLKALYSLSIVEVDRRRSVDILEDLDAKKGWGKSS